MKAIKWQCKSYALTKKNIKNVLLLPYRCPKRTSFFSSLRFFVVKIESAKSPKCPILAFFNLLSQRCKKTGYTFTSNDGTETRYSKKADTLILHFSFGYSSISYWYFGLYTFFHNFALPKFKVKYCYCLLDHTLHLVLWKHLTIKWILFLG